MLNIKPQFGSLLPLCVSWNAALRASFSAFSGACAGSWRLGDVFCRRPGVDPPPDAVAQAERRNGSTAALLSRHGQPPCCLSPPALGGESPKTAPAPRRAASAAAPCFPHRGRPAPSLLHLSPVPPLRTLCRHASIWAARPPRSAPVSTREPVALFWIPSLPGKVPCQVPDGEAEVVVSFREFLVKLRAYAEENQHDTKSDGFPKAANRLRGYITRFRPLVADAGYSIEIQRKTEKNRFSKNARLIKIRLPSSPPPVTRRDDGEDGEHGEGTLEKFP